MHRNNLGKTPLGFLALLLGVTVSPIYGGNVNFENAASYGGDNAVISSGYFAQYGLQISAVAGTDRSTASDAVLAFEAAGADGSDAFWTGRNGRDQALSGDLGNYLMKAGSGDLSYSNSKYFNLSIKYEEATSAASAEVWDIDGPEQYKVTAFDANENELASVTSPVGGLDGEPWAWSFDVGAANIAQIDVEFIGSKTLRGFAFDNFNSTEANPNASTHAAPLPAALPLGIVGLAATAWLRRRNDQVALELDPV